MPYDNTPEKFLYCRETSETIHANEKCNWDIWKIFKINSLLHIFQYTFSNGNQKLCILPIFPLLYFFFFNLQICAPRSEAVNSLVYLCQRKWMSLLTL